LSNNKTKRQLDSVDWDFPTQFQGLTKISHWYPGTFPPQLPSTLIQALTVTDDLVFDPYGGSGTTASEAIRLGRKAWVIDVNPIGIVSNYLYISLLLFFEKSEEDLKLLFNQIENLITGGTNEILGLGFNDINNSIQKYHEIVINFMRPSPTALLDKALFDDVPDWESLGKWIHPRSLMELKDIHNCIESDCENDSVKLLFFSMVSSNLRAICSQNKSWGHIADNVYPKEFIYKDVKTQLRKWLKTLKTNILKVKFENNTKIEGIRYWAEIYNWNSSKGTESKPDNIPKIIITSPPYGDAIDYIFSQKLSLYFLGYDENALNSLNTKEIGARRKRFKSDSRDKWAAEMSEAAVKQSKYISDGLFIIVLPHKNHGREIGIKMIKKNLKSKGWSQIFEIDRSISQKRTRQSWTSIKQETINIFKCELKDD